MSQINQWRNSSLGINVDQIETIPDAVRYPTKSGRRYPGAIIDVDTCLRLD